MELSSSQRDRASYKKRSRSIIASVCLLSFVAFVLILIVLFRSRDNAPIVIFPFGSDALSFDGSGRILFVVHNGSIEVQDLEKGKQIAVAGQKGEEITTLALDRNRESAYSGTAKGDLKPFDLTRFQFSDGIPMGSSKTFEIAISPKNNIIAASFFGEYSKVVVGEPRGGRVIYENPRGGRSIALSDDESLLAFCGSGGRGKRGFYVVHLPWPNDNAMDFVPFKGETVGGEVLAFIGGLHVVAIAQSEIIWLWDCDSKQELASLPFQGHYVFTALACTQDGKTLIAAIETSIYLCQVDPLRLIRKVTAFEKADVNRLAVSADGLYLAASRDDIGFDDRPGYGQTKVWRLDKLLGK